MADLTVDRALAAASARQHSILSQDQLIDCGLNRRTITRRTQRGTLREVFRRAFFIGGGAHLPPLALETAALLSCGETATLSHLTALSTWRMIDPPAGAPVHVTVVGRVCAGQPGIRLHRVQQLARHDHTVHDGLAVTTPARALLESATLLSRRALERALREGIGHKRVSPPGLLGVCERYPGSRGVALIRELADPGRASQITESEAEAALDRLLRGIDAPPSRTQVWDGPYRGDRVWTAQRVWLEVDSFQWHSDREPFESDHRRAEYLKDRGWAVVRVTARQVVHEPEYVAFRVGVALGRAMAAAAA